MTTSVNHIPRSNSLLFLRSGSRERLMRPPHYLRRPKKNMPISAPHPARLFKKDTSMTDTFNHRRHPLILIVDDGMTIRLLVREALEQAGFFVEEAENGRQALKMFQQLPPDLVLLDVMMPELDGFETCAAL